MSYVDIGEIDMKMNLFFIFFMVLSLDLLACPVGEFEFVDFDEKNFDLEGVASNLKIEVAKYENPLFSPVPCFGGISILIRSTEVDKRLYNFDVRSKFYDVSYPVAKKGGAYRGILLDERTMIFNFPLRVGAPFEEHKNIAIGVSEFTIGGRKRATGELLFSLK
ncbi:hypothetical protein [Vandammella animalimorsus]|uniref:hypothetical protein n=2 Tax=Vandammella animalimorsus TaxID=2029117 RepID=UPI001177967E|nr:hypothetical protein [Vandammella animalimorsus]